MSFPPPASLEARGGCDGAVPPSGEPGDWRHSSSSQAVSWAAVFDSVCGSVFASVEAGVAALSQSALPAAGPVPVEAAPEAPPRRTRSCSAAQIRPGSVSRRRTGHPALSQRSSS